MNVLIVGLGGFAGAACRYLVNSWVLKVSPQPFPFGTLTVNVVGCFLIGLFHGITDARDIAKPELRLFLVVGVLGGFTTYSAFGHDTFELIRSTRIISAAANVTAHITLGLLAVAIGDWLGRAT